MRRIAPLLIAAAVSVASAEAAAETRQVTLLHINDVYEIAPDDTGLGGFAPLARLVAEHEPALVTFGGDLLSPSVLSSVTQGAHMVTLMNTLGADVAVPGNHEFDFGADVFADRLKESDFPWLAANMSGLDGIQARKMVETDGLKVGLFGLITPETASLAAVGGDIRFFDPMAAARQQVDALRSDGADIIVALTHLPLEQDLAVARLRGIDVVLGGHDHEPWTHYDGDTLILKAGYDARFLGVVKLSLETDGRRRTVIPEWALVPVQGSGEPHMAEQVGRFQAALDGEMSAALATTTTAFDSLRATVRGGEAAIGNLITDAMRAATGADIALTNGGGIRGEATYDAGRSLTRGDVVKELPFGNLLEVVTLTGAELRGVLEHAVSALPEGGGRFLQVSGLTLTFAPAKPVGERVQAIRVNGRPLDDGATYSVAINDYLGRGGDGFAMLAGAPRVVPAEGGRLLATAVMDHLTAAGTVAPATEGRITAIAP